MNFRKYMTLDSGKHRNILLKILKDIYTDQRIAPLLGFKGGTAAYMFYALDRFSVDLDFDLLDTDKEDEIFERIQSILSEYGKLKEAKKKRSNLFFILSYEERLQNIKVEINLRNFNSRYEIMTYFGIAMKVMVREDMFAHKIVAMMERIGKTNRDIYDVWFFLRNDWPINKEIVEKRTHMFLKDFLKKCIEALEKMSNTDILSGMGELLNEKQKNWVKNHLKEDVLFLLKVRSESEK